jgi:hypothetical protein
LLGTLSPVLLMMSSVAREHAAPEWLTAGLGIGGISCVLTFWFLPAASNFHLPAFGMSGWPGNTEVNWAWLPIPMRTHYRAFLAWNRRAHGRRWAMCAVLFVSFAVTAHLFHGMLMAGNLTPALYPNPTYLWRGPLSLLSLGIGLVGGMLLGRACGIQSFAAPLTAGFHGRGSGKLHYGIAVFCFLITVVLTGATGGLGVVAAASGKLLRWWPGLLGLFLAAEGFRALTLHSLLFYVNRSKGDTGAKRSL